MNCPINVKRLIIGGLAAGVWINIVETVVHTKILGERYMNLTKMGFYFSQPRFHFVRVWVLLSFFLGLILCWLYAVSRDTLKPGPLTALKVGIAAGILAAMPGTIAAAAWSRAG